MGYPIATLGDKMASEMVLKDDLWDDCSNRKLRNFHRLEVFTKYVCNNEIMNATIYSFNWIAGIPTPYLTVK
jgi:hypothetical protein